MHNVIFLAIFTIHSIPPVNVPPNGHVYYLDDINILQTRLNTEVKKVYEITGENHIQKTAMNFIDKNHRQYSSAINTIKKVQQYNVTKIPAVVINGKYQVIGTANPTIALKMFNRSGLK